MELIGVSYPTLVKWRNGESEPDDRTIARLCEKINKIEGIQGELKQECFFDDQFSIYQFGMIFGLDRNECSKIIDSLFYTDAPLLNSFYHEVKTANGIYSSYNGLYIVYRMGISNEPCTLHDVFLLKIHVRYTLEVKKGFLLLRCKMHVPDLQRRIIQYDGFLSRIDGYLYWMFEARTGDSSKKGRSGIRPDLVYIITDGGERVSERNMVGVYSTINQDRNPRPVSTPVFFKRIYENDQVDDRMVESFMYEEPEIVRNGEGIPADILEKIKK